MSEILSGVCQIFQITVLFLPTYSPELNPCELVFAQIKRRIRLYREYDHHIYREVLLAIANVNYANVVGYYFHCLFPEVILPDVLLNDI